MWTWNCMYFVSSTILFASFQRIDVEFVVEVTKPKINLRPSTPPPLFFLYGWSICFSSVSKDKNSDYWFYNNHCCQQTEKRLNLWFHCLFIKLEFSLKEFFNWKPSLVFFLGGGGSFIKGYLFSWQRQTVSAIVSKVSSMNSPFLGAYWPFLKKSPRPKENFL